MPSQGVPTKWKNLHKYGLFHTLQKARDGTRTRDPDLGKVVHKALSEVFHELSATD